MSPCVPWRNFLKHPLKLPRYKFWLVAAYKLIFHVNIHTQMLWTYSLMHKNEKVAQFMKITEDIFGNFPLHHACYTGSSSCALKDLASAHWKAWEEQDRWVQLWVHVAFTDEPSLVVLHMWMEAHPETNEAECNYNDPKQGAKYCRNSRALSHNTVAPISINRVDFKDPWWWKYHINYHIRHTNINLSSEVILLYLNWLETEAEKWNIL